MVPKPQNETEIKFNGTEKDDGESVVISGISGLYPNCKNVKEFGEVLYNKVNPISPEHARWQCNHPEASSYTGTIPGLDRFDAQFFKVHYRFGTTMDAMSKKVLEQCYQALYDAGISLETINGKKVAVFVGSCFSETEKAAFYCPRARTGFGVAGCNKSMFANRISYWLNLKGPSMAIDESCCSSAGALTQAYHAMSRGDCEAAIVGGCNLFLHPHTSILTSRSIDNAPDGKTKCFDEKADGSVMSEAIQVVFLQKAKDALRIYAELIYIKNEFANANNTGDGLGLYRNPTIMTNFLKNFYNHVNVSPEAVEYVETMGAAIPDVEKAELETISNVFCKDRSNPLLVGSVMSNIGYTEASSGLCAVVKALLAYQTGKIPANLHFNNPRKDVPALLDGRMSVVTDTEPFRRGYIAINNHSLTGCSAHILLNGRYKPKDFSRYKSSIPHLVTISTRQERSIQTIFDDLKSRPVDPEELALFHNIHKTNVTGHLGRGFIILDTDKDKKTVSLAEKSEYFDNARRPLWFVYSGMGSQWPGMGTQLMRIPIFAAAIERCQRALEPKGIDLVHILTSTDKQIFDNILHSFVGIAAVQIGLTDVLREIGLVPDKIIGHSGGELGCAYGDGCFTAEEMILSAYSRGLVSVQTPFIRGAMAAVGVGYQEIKDMLPPEIEVACHNSAASSTISGPADVMKEFVASLVAKGIFAKEVPCSNIAYHSRYIAEAGPKLLKKLTEIIKKPKERSDRWISTSVPKDNWEQPENKISSAEYHTNNLLNPVLFEEALTLIPADAILVEIAPHGLLQAILKRALPNSCKHIPLTRRGHSDNALMVLKGIGTLYLEGYNSKISALYPEIEFPVSTETPMLSHLIEWAHDEKWVLPLYVYAAVTTAAAANYVICLHDPEHAYLEGHVVQGRNGYPFAAVLDAVWKTLAMYLRKPKEKLSVIFHDVQFFAEPILSDRQLKISVSIHKGEGNFEVLEGNSKVATGFINQTGFEKSETNTQTEMKEMTFNCKDIYQLLHDRDYAYRNAFRSIHAANESFTDAQLRWDDEWVTLIDGMIQMNILRQKHHAVSKPIRMRKMIINTTNHYLASTTTSEDQVLLDAIVDELANTTRCGGVFMDNIQFDNLPRSSTEKTVIKTLQFVPHFNLQTDLKTSVQVSLQIVAENVNKNLLNVVEVVNTTEKTASFHDVKENDVPGLKINYRQCSNKELLAGDLKNVDLVLVHSLSTDDDLCNHLHSVLKNNVLILSAEEKTQNTRARPSSVYKVVASQNAGEIVINLLKWRPCSQSSTTAITVRTPSDLSVLLKTRNCLAPNQKLQVLTSYPPVPYTKELVENWRMESERKEINLVMVDHSIKEDEGRFEIPELELAVNILNESVWGGEYYIPLINEPAIAQFVSLRNKSIGDLKSLSWIESSEPIATGIPVTVRYAALNTVDAMKAAGVYLGKEGNDVDEISYGMDFSGVTESGVRVMGLIESGAASNRVSAHRELLWPVPKHWTLEDAATVPMPYAMAFYCLVIKCRMLPNTSILVHGGAGALGQAVISIALAHGLQVFTTVSDMRKKHFLRKLFPDLKEDHIGNSRDFSFRDMVLTGTKGRGVSYVLNCLKSEYKDVSMTCAGDFSVVIDTSQIHSGEYYTYQFKNLYREGCYTRVDFSSIFDNKINKLDLQYLISEGITRGYVRPLTRVTYATTEVSRALHLLEASQHRGRVLLAFSETPKGQPRITCSPYQTQIVICNDQTFGVNVADRLVKRGARKLLLQLPTLTPQVLYKKRLWQEVGVAVNMYTNNLNTEKNIKEMLITGTKMGAVEGIYTVATHFNNDIKRETLINLDVVSRKLCPSLKNYAVISNDDKFGNELCLLRVQQQLPANKICLPSINMIDEVKLKPSEEGISSWVACDAFEFALCSKQTITKVQVQKSKTISILHDIARISDIKLPEIINEDDTLMNLGISIDKTQSIAALLQKKYNYALMKEKILELSVKEIRELEQVFNGQELKETKGLKIFFTHSDSDELSSTTDIMIMSTLFDHTMLRDDDFDTTLSYLCIIPGLEGHYERFRMLCERLKMPAVVVQPALEATDGSIKQLAARNAQLLLKKVNIKDNFYLLGYESGALVALETAAILEEHGLIGTVYLIGAPADQFKAFLMKEIEQYATDKELQKAVLKHMYEVMSNTEFSLKLDDDLEWNERVEICMRDLLNHIPLSAEYARLNLKMPVYRIKQVLEYKPELPTLQSKLVLLQPKDLSCEEIPAALQKLTKQSLAAHKLTMPLAQALEDLQSATFINQHLDETILENFNTKNLCVTYVLNPDIFKTLGDDEVAE